MFEFKHFSMKCSTETQAKKHTHTHFIQKKFFTFVHVIICTRTPFFPIHAICSQITTRTSGSALCVFHVFKKVSNKVILLCVCHCQRMLPTLVSISLPLTSKAGQENEQKKQRKKERNIQCVFFSWG